MTKFQNLTVDYKALFKMTNSERVQYINSSAGQNMVAQLTPAQLADLFPKNKEVPTLGGAMKTVTDKTFVSRDQTPENSRESTASPQTGGRVNPRQPSGGGNRPTVDRAKPRQSYSTVPDQSIPAGKAGLIKQTYDAFREAGLSDNQAKAAVAEVNRENSFNPKHMFGTHEEMSDAGGAKGRINHGIFSWGDPKRAAAFKSHMQKNGVMDDQGKILVDQKTYLKEQTKFAVDEMRTTKSGQAFLSNPDISKEDARNSLGSHIGWDMAGRRHDASASYKRLEEGYSAIDRINRNSMSEQSGKTSTEVQREAGDRTSINTAVDNAMMMKGKKLGVDSDDIKQYMKNGGVGLNPEKQAWCAAYVNASLHKSGIKGSETVSNVPMVATSFLKWGDPVDITKGINKGDVMVRTRSRNNGQELGPDQVGGHVGMSTGNTRINEKTGETEYEMIQGNTGSRRNGTNRVDTTWERESSITFRRANDSVLPPVIKESAETKPNKTEPKPSVNLEEKPKNDQAQTKNSEKTESSDEAPLVEAYADGGKVKTKSETLKAYPIDKSKSSRDNVIVANEKKPLFTMNDKEKMTYDPDKGEVDIKKPEYKPLDGSSRQQNQQQPQIKQPSQRMSVDTTVSMTHNIFKSPSFERAIARTRFQNSGDEILGGHFDHGAANIMK